MTVTEYIIANRDVLKLEVIEKLIPIPTGTIRRAINESKEIPYKHQEKLYHFIKSNLSVVSPPIISRQGIADITQYTKTPQGYVHKKTGEITNIHYSDGAFRFY